MHLTYRPGSANDVPVIFQMFPAGFSLEPDDLDLLSIQLKAWISKGLCNLTIIENLDDFGSIKVIAFGMSFFVTDAYMDWIDKKITPPLLLSTIKIAQNGSMPLLNIDQVAKANSSSGLNLVIPIIGWSKSVEDQNELIELKVTLMEAFFYAHKGYKIRNCVQEIYSESEMIRAQNIGAKLRHENYGANNKEITTELRPYLVGMNRQEAVEGTYLHPIFLFNPPKFYFSHAQREVLKLAILDMSDEEIASQLSLGEATIKKRWRSIFTRASLSKHVMWMPLSKTSENVERGSGRGNEKRRHIITYVRSHMEELRPYQPHKD
jgi:DNA-binding CsgD family transcriptional regulator